MLKNKKSILRNILPRQEKKKTVYLLFCVFQTMLNKVINIFSRLPEWTRNLQMISGFTSRLRCERGWKS